MVMAFGMVLPAHALSVTITPDKTEAKVEEECKSANFLDWLEERIYIRDVKESTRRQHFVMLNELRKFGKIKNFRDLTTRNIKLWDDMLRERLGTQSTVHGYHKR